MPIVERFGVLRKARKFKGPNRVEPQRMRRKKGDWILVHDPELGKTESWFTKGAVFCTLEMGNWLPGMIFENNNVRYEVVGSGEEQRLEQTS